MALQQTLISQVHFNNTKERQVNLSFLAALAIGTLLSLVAFINVNTVLEYYFINALQIILFFVFGNLYISLKRNFINFQAGEKPHKRILLISVLLCMILSALYFFKRKDVLTIAFSSSAAFLLPSFLKLGWSLFIQIPGREFSTWIPQEKSAYKAAVSLNNFLVRLKLTQHVSDIDEKIYTVFIPHYVKLGDFFSQFLAARNASAASSIEDISAWGNKYAWEFFKSSFYGLRLKRIDPELTMAENKIDKDALLYIKRLAQPVKPSSYNKKIINEAVKQR